MDSFKTACFISLNPKHWKQRTKIYGRTSKATLVTKGAHTQHSFRCRTGVERRSPTGAGDGAYSFSGAGSLESFFTGRRHFEV
jgi:hypothetical protein